MSTGLDRFLNEENKQIYLKAEEESAAAFRETEKRMWNELPKTMLDVCKSLLGFKTELDSEPNDDEYGTDDTSDL